CGGSGGRREAARAAAGERGRGGAEERLCTGRGVGGGAPHRGATASRARGIDDDRAVHRRPGRAAPDVPCAARAAGCLAGGGFMAADALDGDVRGLRPSGRGGGNGDPLGYRPVRSAGTGGDVSGDAFHLTPHDVRKQEFRRTLRGYEPLGVDDFRVRVADELERILRERSVLDARLAALTDQLRAFRERERAMNEALVAAQQLREDTRTAAQREAQVIVREAEAEARRIIEEARSAESDVRRQLGEAERQFQAYLGGFRALLERQ